MCTKAHARANLACKEDPDRGQLLLRCHPEKDVGTPFPSCTRSSFDTSPSVLPGCPCTHWCTGRLPALLTPCQPCSPPARLCGQAGQPAWEARLVSGRISPAALHAQMLPPRTNAALHAHPTCAQGETPRDARGDGAARGRCLHCRQGMQAAGHHAAGSAKARQAKQSKIPGGRLCSAPASKGLSSLHKPPQSPGLLCPLHLLRPPRARLVPKSEPANQQLPAAAALRLP